MMGKSKNKQVLSIEQMQKLQSIGVDTSGASAVWQSGSATKHEWTLRFVGYMDNHLHDRVYAFTLQDIINLLPARINHFFDLYIDKDSIGYIDLHNDGKNGDVLIGFTTATCGSLIDAAYILLQWVILNNICKAVEILDLSKSNRFNEDEMKLSENQIEKKKAQIKGFFEDLLLSGKVYWENEEKTEIRNKIEDIIIKKYSYLDEKTDFDKSFTEMGLDSLDMVELVMKIEREFDISISDDLWINVDTVGNAVDVVYKLKKGEQG